MHQWCIFLNIPYLKLWGGGLKIRGWEASRCLLQPFPERKKDFRQNTGMNKQKQPISMETTHLQPGQREHASACLTVSPLTRSQRSAASTGGMCLAPQSPPHSMAQVCPRGWIPPARCHRGWGLICCVEGMAARGVCPYSPPLWFRTGQRV